MVEATRGRGDHWLLNVFPMGTFIWSFNKNAAVGVVDLVHNGIILKQVSYENTD